MQFRNAPEKDVSDRLLSAVLALFVVLSIAIAPLPAQAQNVQDYCIKCTNPDQSYICRIVSNSGNAQGKQLLCIMNIAREHGHDSCAATNQSQSCSGVLVQYEASSTPSESPVTPEANVAVLPPAPKQIKASKEPKTLVEFTKETTRATQKSLKSVGRNTHKAISKTGRKITKFTHKTGKKITKFTHKVGHKISKATKTTWKCITSLFASCGK